MGSIVSAADDDSSDDNGSVTVSGKRSECAMCTNADSYKGNEVGELKVASASKSSTLMLRKGYLSVKAELQFRSH